MKLAGRDEELSYKIDLNACPIFFAYGDEPMTFFPDLENLLRVQFTPDAWLEEI